MFVPYDDINPTERTPVLTYLLIGVNVAIHCYLVFVVFPSATPEALAALKSSYLEWGCSPDTRFQQLIGQVSVQQQYQTWFFYRYGLVPANAEPITFLSSMFLHGGFAHLLGNMLFLWITGDNLEDRFGHLMFLGLYFVSGLVAAFSQMTVAGADCTPMIGASGAIAGAMGAYMLLFPWSKIKVFVVIFPLFFGTIRINAFLWLGLWILFQVMFGTAATGGGGGVAYWAHIGGFGAGLSIALIAWLSGFVEGGVKRTDFRGTRGPGGRRSSWDRDRHGRRGPWS